MVGMTKMEVMTMEETMMQETIMTMEMRMMKGVKFLFCISELFRFLHI